MIHKVPVIATNVGGLPEIIQEGVSGFLLNVGDFKGMARQGLELLLNPQKHDDFKNQAFEQAQLFDLKRIVEQYESVYQEAILKKSY